ncbi:hypothetical protein HBHAL_2422 [Halobacillus halophilus DSM 2266]|uniref:Uncharacterized protein n=1 Tax=Halobacillus halophilus (strain ATCC 35676 / DSM 2266 / JCM 20832 / KCTC 3685 / LMG 17431 / NBRC 102448 / NCIMB 2269) TaxID=866895 RepID=I0JKU7_HALH3|nr:hypothetical protein HBHAL_2422 [Halobacillus halophilus DSM 2266]
MDGQLTVPIFLRYFALVEDRFENPGFHTTRRINYK